ncbi:four helix bundle protein [Nostoc punctiforme NIES-2108]|uniref:Four helix bundle protein n=1 Tax=Nostoc punctiforme NIES-2108 TaxID=1356359 RepID=A0A367R5Y5_NOSPU|nr:four helix bundle protein [Nostoc punctiforme NIES-2108]
MRSKKYESTTNQQLSIADRTKALAIRIVKACTFLDEKPGVCRTLSKQLLRSGTSIGANVKEAQSAQSDKDFLSKLEIALKEERETEYWLEILIEAELVDKNKFESLLQETREIGKILVSSTRKVKEKINKLN